MLTIPYPTRGAFLTISHLPSSRRVEIASDFCLLYVFCSIFGQPFPGWNKQSILFLLLPCGPCRNVVLLMCRHIDINILELPILLACGCWASQWQPDVGIRMPRPARFGKQKTPSRPERSVLLRVGPPNPPASSVVCWFSAVRWVFIGSFICLNRRPLSPARQPPNPTSLGSFPPSPLLHGLVPSFPTHGHLFLLESHRSLATTYLFPEICSRNLAPTFRAPLAEHYGRMRLFFVGSLACLGAHHHRRRNHECHSGGIVEELVS